MPVRKYTKRFNNFKKSSKRASSSKRSYSKMRRPYSSYKTPYKAIPFGMGNQMLPGEFKANAFTKGMDSLAKAAGIPAVFGHGDYTINMGGKLASGTSPPQFGSSKGSKSVRVQHREYIQDVVSSPTAGAFLIQGFGINPGNPALMPWLSSVASNFEVYRLHGMIFEFKTMSADALSSVQTALGTVIMATSYNSANPTFFSKQQMENYEFAQSAKPSESMCHYVECSKNGIPLGELYTRDNAVPTGQPSQFYDVGTFNIATVGLPGTNVLVGELWVTYDVELFKPKLYIGGATSGGTAFFHASFTAPVGTNLFSGTQTTKYNSFPSGLTLGTTPNGSTSIQFNSPVAPVGSTYIVNIQVNGSGAATTVAPSAVTYANAQGVNIFGNSTQATFGSSQTTTNWSWEAAFVITSQVGANNGLANITGYTNPTTVTSIDLFITQVPNGIS
uniref:Capsid protein n=1 Tax=Cruciviridae sp. TaxID=1955495 RepID=A0A1S6LVH4_9VIRU|nr:capsid protein [Cruciviridae sp.]